MLLLLLGMTWINLLRIPLVLFLFHSLCINIKNCYRYLGSWFRSIALKRPAFNYILFLIGSVPFLKWEWFFLLVFYADQWPKQRLHLMLPSNNKCCYFGECTLCPAGSRQHKHNHLEGLFFTPAVLSLVRFQWCNLQGGSFWLTPSCVSGRDMLKLVTPTGTCFENSPPPFQMLLKQREGRERKQGERM